MTDIFHFVLCSAAKAMCCVDTHECTPGLKAKSVLFVYVSPFIVLPEK